MGKERQEGREEVVPFAEKFLELAMHGDYSNGNEEYGCDEGRVMAGKLLDEYEREWKAQKEKWRIK